MSGQSSFTSSLDRAADRFLSSMMVYALDEQWRTPDDFIRHFKPLDLMLGLADADSLRAELLVKAAGVHEKIAHKKSTESATEDLQIALDEGITTSSDILKLLPPDERVRYLDKKRLWSFVIEDSFWSKGQTDRERCVARMSFALQVALDQSLVTLQDIADGVTFETIADRLPPDRLRQVVVHALKASRRSTPLTETGLLEVVPLDQLIGFLPLDLLWDSVIVAKVAAPAGFAEAPGAKAEPVPDSAPKAAKPSEKKAEGKKADKKASESKPEPKPAEVKPASFAPPPPPSTPPGRPSSIPPLADVDDSDDETRMVTNLGALAGLPTSDTDSRSPQEEDARRKVADKLRAIDRLPPSYEKLSTPILLSIESMYAELLSCTDDESRESCIRESFPNEGHLRTALLALIELLDPSIDVHDPLIRDAEVESLIKVVLFEERHRYEQQHRSRPSPAPAGASPTRRASIPPPLPRPAPGQPIPPLPLPPDDKRAR